MKRTLNLGFALFCIFAILTVASCKAKEEQQELSDGSGALESVVCRILEADEGKVLYAEILSAWEKSGLKEGETVKLCGENLDWIKSKEDQPWEAYKVQEGISVKAYYDRIGEEEGEKVLYVHGFLYLQEEESGKE